MALGFYFDMTSCIGCQACANACPYMVPKYYAEKKIVNKCDSCAGIRANGGEPQRVFEAAELSQKRIEILRTNHYKRLTERRKRVIL